MSDAESEPAGGQQSQGLAPPDIVETSTLLGYASFAIDFVSDLMTWSANAPDVLGLNRYEVPRTGKAFQRLLTPDGAMARVIAHPPARLDADPDAARYVATYDLLPRNGRAHGVHLREEGVWIADAGGTIIAARGLVRALEQPALLSDANDARLACFQRDQLFSILDGLAHDLARDPGGAAVFLAIAVNDVARINASFGYEIGDRLIEAVGQRIQRRMRQHDVMGKLSGHKFGIILHHCSDQAALVAAERFRQVVTEQAFEIGSTTLRADIAIGAVAMPRHAGSANGAALRAEEALVEARRDPEKAIALYYPSPTRDAERRLNLEMADEIHRGIAEGRFVLAYQPVVSARTREILSYEALLRLVTRDGHLRSAGPYIATAERVGIIRHLDVRALNLVLADLADNPTLRLSVNVSADTITDRTWISVLLATARDNGPILKRLTVEVTETAALLNIDDLIQTALTLREVGCRIAIDDFGSGHTSLKVLRDIKPDWLKIDGAYIRDFAADADAAVFVRALSALANHFGIRTIAEFVQDDASARQLDQLGVSALQGKLTGGPLLRVHRETAEILRDAERLVSDTEADGYAVCAGVLKGPLSLDGLPGNAVPGEISRSSGGAGAPPG